MSRESTAQQPPPQRQQASKPEQEKQEQSVEDDSDFVLVVNRKKSHQVQSSESQRKQRQSYEQGEEEHHNASYQGRRRKYRDRGGGDQKGYRRRDKSHKHDKENINKTGTPAVSQGSTQQRSLPTSPPPPQSQPVNLPTPSGRSFSLVVACGSSGPSTQQPPQKSTNTESVVLPNHHQISLSDQSNDQETRLTNRQILMVMKPKQESLSGTGPSTSSSIPDTSSLTSEETLDSTDRKTSAADIESNGGNSTPPMLEWVDAPAPKVNPWVANRNAAQVITGSNGLPSNVALNGFPSVVDTITEKKPLTEQPPPTQKPQQNSNPKKEPQQKNPPTSPTSFKEAVSKKEPAHELPKQDQPQQQEPPPSVYVREMSNGFRPGRGRGSYSASASAGRKIPSRSSVLMKVLSSDNSTDDWPTLGEAVVGSRAQKLSSSGDEESAGEVQKSEDAVDSQAKQLEVKSCEEQPPQHKDSVQKQSASPPPPPQQNETETTSSSDNEDDVNSSSKQRKGSKQKWVPLDMTSQGGAPADNPPPEHKKSGKGRHSKYHPHYHNGYQRAKGKENMAINGGSDYSDYTHPRYTTPRHTHRSTQMNPRGPPSNSNRSRRHHSNQHRSSSTLSLNNHSMMNGSHPPHHHAPYEIITSPTQPPSDYQDFPPDFTTLTPMYPAVSDFIMPYVANGYFPTPFTPPAGVIVEPGTDVVGGVPIVVATTAPQPAPSQVSFQNGDMNVLTDLVRTQIEYYFSEENLAKDFYLRRKMDKKGYLPVHLLATFPRVKQMTQDYTTVITAIQTSETLELRQDMQSVRTKSNPEKWPILDNSPTHKPPPPLPTPQKKCINNNNTPIGAGVVETLNPNVPEFVPKSKIAL